jgi:hypothetical protein
VTFSKQKCFNASPGFFQHKFRLPDNIKSMSGIFFKTLSKYSYLHSRHMSTTSLIVAIKGTDNVEQDGAIVRLEAGASMDTLRSRIADKLAIATDKEGLILEDTNGDRLTTIEQARKQQVIFVNLDDQIKLPAVPARTLPYFGNLYELLPDM